MESTDVSDCSLQNEFLTPEEEQEILANIENSYIWKPRSKSDTHTLIYGPQYDKHNKLIPEQSIAHPVWLQVLAKKVYDSVDYPNKDKLLNPEQYEVYINEYNSVRDLRYHFDNNTIFDEYIYGISLIADSHTGFKTEKETCKVSLPTRSMYVMSSKCRTQYKHNVDEGWIAGKRVSIIFRTVSEC